MDTERILSELKQQRDAVNQAIAALEGTPRIRGRRSPSASKKTTKRRRRLSAAARKRISQAAKARWAQAKKAGRNSL